MSNKKVYLAKNTLASGFDVEYVKSHLLRIPGIILIESGMSFGPGDCVAFVIVGDNELSTDKYEYQKINLSKNVTKELETFLEHQSDTEDVFIYSQNKPTDEHGDVEKDFPLALSNYNLEINYKKKENHDKFAYCEIHNNDEYELIQEISNIIDSKGWQKVPRHFAPPEEYAVPGVPSIEERQLNTMSVSTIITDFSKSSNSANKKLLLLRRK